MRARRSARLLTLIALAVSTAAAGADAAQRAIVIGNDAPAWSPDGTRIAFTAFRHGNGEIYSMRSGGGGETRLTNTAAHEDHAAWSPDGTRIAFASTRDGNYEIYVMDADGSNERRLTTSDRNDYLPTWSPDGREIAWQSDRAGDFDIYAMDPAGGNVRRLTSGPSVDTSPSWSRDGRIAFSSRVGGVYNIYVMNADGSARRPVTTGATNKDRPAWSPDSTKLLYVSEQDLPVGNTEIYVVDAAGGEGTRVTNFGGRDDWPAWAPDGTRFVFTRGVTYRSPEIFVGTLTDTAITRLTSTASRLEVVDAYAPPPVAGRSWSILLLAEDVTDQPLRATRALCRATLAGRPVRLAGRGAEAGTVRCTWTLPSSARGKTIRGTIGIASGRLRTQLPFSLKVR